MGFCVVCFVLVGIESLMLSFMLAYYCFNLLSISSLFICCIFIVSIPVFILSFNMSQFASFTLSVAGAGFVTALVVSVNFIGMWSDSVRGPGLIIVLCSNLLFPGIMSGAVWLSLPLKVEKSGPRC